MVDEVRSNIRLLLKYVEYKPEINSSLINALSLGKKNQNKRSSYSNLKKYVVWENILFCFILISF